MNALERRTRQHRERAVARLPEQLAGRMAPVLDDHLQRLRGLSDHRNRVCHYDQVLCVHLLGFWDPLVRSLRTLDARSVADRSMHQATDGLRVARSTLSDAMREMPAAALLPLIERLLACLPNDCSHPELADLMTLKKRIHAIDGSYFRVPADVLWALAHTRSNGRVGRQVRLDLHLDVLRFLPVKAQVDGKDRGSESAAFIPTLEAGLIYLADRNFIHYDFLASVIDAKSDFVVRLRSDIHPTTVQSLPLAEADTQAGVIEDRQVRIDNSRWATPVPGVLREVTVFDPVKREPVRLLTTLLEVPAALIGRLYRHRWAIELFFRWLKCVAKVRHLYSESSNGMTMQFYLVIIATLLSYLQLGHRPSLYVAVLLESAARGDLILEKVPEVLERIARERELERLRRLKKQA